MTAAEIIYRILTQIKSGNLSDDFSLSDDLIFNQICSVRSRLIRQERSAGKWTSSLYVQDLGSIELQLANKHDLCAVDTRDCPVLRSVLELPKAVDTATNDMYTFVGTLDGISFERTTSGASRYMQHSKFTGKKPKYYFIGNYLYVVNPSTNLLKYINVQGVFENTLEAESFKKCGGANCFNSYDFEMPISSTIVDTLVQLVITEIRGSRILPSDNTNDSKDD